MSPNQVALEDTNNSDTNLSESQTFRRSGGNVSRHLKFGSNEFHEELVSTRPDMTPEKDFFVSYLAQDFIDATTATKRLNYIDLFCGGGGLSLGVHNASKFMGFKPRLVAAVDLDTIALQLVEAHFRPLFARAKSVEELIKYEVDLSGAVDEFVTFPQLQDSQLAQLKNRVDLLVGGPPCQGHSNLNNRTRRFDPRNLLYFIMPAFAVGLNIKSVIIENVRHISNAHEDVVGITKRIFKNYGYSVEECVMHAQEFGVAQSRSRHFLVARKNGSINLQSFQNIFSAEQLKFEDACMHMPPIPEEIEVIEKNGGLSPENLKRINFLHDNDFYDLPNFARPDCHQEGTTYTSVYGRIKKDLPMTTVTTGFSSPGRGRYVHPEERRVINIREAGRAQAFPDWYWHKAVDLGLKRANFNKIIGDAVPSLFAYPLLASAIL
jgi:DNA (cytosine-5)-methyltransferase 1